MFSLLIVNQANTMVLLTAIFILATWLEEKERERRMRWHVNLPDIPDHLQPVEHFFPHVIPIGAKRTLPKKKKDKTALFRVTIDQEKYNFSNRHKSTKNH